MLAVTLEFTVKTLKLDDDPPPETVSAAAGPAIVSAVLTLDSSSVPRLGERVMVCGVAKAPAVSKTTVLGAGLAILAGLALVLTLAQPTPRAYASQ